MIEGITGQHHPTPNAGLVPGQPANPKLWKAATDFQTILLSQFVKTMRSTAIKNELFEEAAGRETFDQMFSEAIAQEMAENDALRLNRLIYQQLGGKFDTAAPDAAQAGPGAAMPGTHIAEDNHAQ